MFPRSHFFASFSYSINIFYFISSSCILLYHYSNYLSVIYLFIIHSFSFFNLFIYYYYFLLFPWLSSMSLTCCLQITFSLVFPFIHFTLILSFFLLILIYLLLTLQSFFFLNFLHFMFPLMYIWFHLSCVWDFFFIIIFNNEKLSLPKDIITVYNY